MVIRDGNWELLEWDRVTGRTVWTWFDGEKTHIRTDYPIAATLSENRAERNAADKAWKGDWHKVASVPLNLAFDDNLGLMRAHNEGDTKYVARWLNDADNRAWRTKEGNV